MLGFQGFWAIGFSAIKGLGLYGCRALRLEDFGSKGALKASSGCLGLTFFGRLGLNMKQRQ